MTGIIINAQKFDCRSTTLNYDELVQFARLTEKGLMTIMVSYPKQDKKPRSVVRGETIEVLEGMIIVIADTSRA